MGTPASPDDRLLAFGNQLVEIHIWLREELARLRADVDSYLGGRGVRPRQLRAYCLTFCTALSRHHHTEDRAVFPMLERQFPQLRPVLEQLSQDHHVVDGLLRALQALLDGLPADPDPLTRRNLRAELDGLIAVLESHFGYEERQLVDALNQLGLPT